MAGAAVPTSAVQTPARCHGRKHWVEYTQDEQPSQYHGVIRYQDAVGKYIGSSTILLNPGVIRDLLNVGGEVAEERFQEIVMLYEAGKTADEVVGAIETEGMAEIFAQSWKGHVLLEEKEILK